MTSTLRTLSLLVVLAGAAISSGCGSLTSDYCDLKCACEGCSDNQRDECAVEQDARADQAGVYGCDQFHDEYLQCVVDQPPATLCDVANFRDPDACRAQRDRRNSCEGDRAIRIDLRAP